MESIFGPITTTNKAIAARQFQGCDNIVTAGVTVVNDVLDVSHSYYLTDMENGQNCSDHQEKHFAYTGESIQIVGIVACLKSLCKFSKCFFLCQPR